MPAIWPTFQSSVAPYLDDVKTEKTLKQTAKKIADEYHKAVATANIILIPGNMPMKRPSSKGIEDAIADALEKIYKSEKKPMPSHFTPWANELVKYWNKVEFSPVPPPVTPPLIPNPTLAATPNKINKVLNGGVAATIQSGLFAAWNNPPVSTPMGNIICGKMITTFTAHLASISGKYDGALPPPSPPTPTPFPWVGVV